MEATNPPAQRHQWNNQNQQLPERGRDYRKKRRQRSKDSLLQTDRVHNSMYGKSESRKGSMHSMYGNAFEMKGKSRHMDA